MTEQGSRSTSLGPRVIETIAAQLWEAETTGGAVEFPSVRHPDLTWNDARAIARTVDQLRLTGGHARIGYKLGWTSEVMRRSLGIDQPNWGTLWDHQRSTDAVTIGHLRHPKVEPELVYLCGRELAGPDVDTDTVLVAADGWALGHEIVHPRYRDFGFTWLDNTADNSSSQAVVLGEFRSLSGDPGDVAIRFGDGTESRTGKGDAAMGSPARAVAWLVRALEAEGSGLAAGDLVFTGGLAPPFDVIAGRQYDLEADVLQSVSFTAIG